MATHSYYSSHNYSSSQRSVAMVLALVMALVLSPLYASPRSIDYHDSKWSSGFVLPMVLVSLVFAIKTTSSSRRSSDDDDDRVPFIPSDPQWVLRIGSSSWGLAFILVLLVFVLSWQHSVQHFFWR